MAEGEKKGNGGIIVESLIMAWLLSYALSKFIGAIAGKFYVKENLTPLGLAYYSVFGVDIVATSIKQILFVILFIYLFYRLKTYKTEETLAEISTLKKHLAPLGKTFLRIWSFRNLGVLLIVLGLIQIFYYYDANINIFLVIKKYAVEMALIGIILYALSQFFQGKIKLELMSIIQVAVIIYAAKFVGVDVVSRVEGFARNTIREILEIVFNVEQLPKTILTFKINQRLYETWLGAKYYAIWAKFGAGILLILFHEMLVRLIVNPLWSIFRKVWNWIQENYVPILPEIKEIESKKTAFDIIEDYDKEIKAGQDMVTKFALIVAKKNRDEEYQPILDQMVLEMASHSNKRATMNFIKKLQGKYGEDLHLIEAIEKLISEGLKEQKKRKK